MEDDVQIVSVTKPVGRPRRKRKRTARTDGSQDVVFVDSFQFPEITLVELPSPEVVITEVTKQQSPQRKRKSKDSDDKTPFEENELPTAKRKGRNAAPEIPVYWTNCDKCGSLERRYHMIEVPPNSQEWLNLCGPMIRENFTVQRLLRVQNQTLWHRLQCERQLMYRTHFAGFDLNERLLYHTSRANAEVICAEGLDQRLGGGGNFGRGIYFSDNPRKCNNYSAQTDLRKMFACRVLLGDIKVYPRGVKDTSLVREPSKPPSVGGTQTYDSVLGCLNFNEFVVYNTYRVMPEYVIEYQVNSVPGQVQPAPNQHLNGLEIPVTTHFTTQPSLPLCHMCGKLSNTCHCTLECAGHY